MSPLLLASTTSLTDLRAALTDELASLRAALRDRDMVRAETYLTGAECVARALRRVEVRLERERLDRIADERRELTLRVASGTYTRRSG